MRLDQVPGGLRPLRARQRDRPRAELARRGSGSSCRSEKWSRAASPPTPSRSTAPSAISRIARPATSGAPVPGGRARHRVRVAALAGAEALLLRGRDAPEQPDVAAVGQPRRAARPAVHAGRLHGHDEEAVVARIAALHEAVAALEVVDHATIVARCAGGFRTCRSRRLQASVASYPCTAWTRRSGRSGSTPTVPGCPASPSTVRSARTRTTALLREAESQLRAYFAGELTRFDLPALAARHRVPAPRLGRGRARSRTARRPPTRAWRRRWAARSACRAVGAANGRNPLPIVVPCHRVVGASGELTGYGGGLERKRALLDLEAAAG